MDRIQFKAIKDSLLCSLLGHPYLPARKVVMHYSGNMQEVDFLLCSRCGASYRFAFDEYWHRKNDQREYKHAQQRMHGNE